MNSKMEWTETSYTLRAKSAPVRLQYLKGSKEANSWMLQYGAADVRMWNVITPVAGYGQSTVPTFTLATLKEKGLLNKEGL
jgi:hypothetical protein